MHTVRKATGAVALHLILAAGCAQGTKDESGSCDNATAEGYQTLEHNGVTREYILQVPSSYSSDTAVPLVINFHGNGGCASQYDLYESENMDLSAVANAENFIVAYPQGVIRAKGAAEWDPGATGVENINDDDVFFTEQLVAQISSQYTIDSAQVYAVGYSNGGMMAYGLACHSGSLVAAVGIMSGIMLPGTCTATDYTSVIHFHGTADDALPYDGNQEYQSVANVVDFWVQHNNIPSASLVSTALNDGDVRRDEYSGGNENTSVVLYTITGGGHVWFNDPIDGEEPNQILWDFLSGYNLTGSTAN